MCCVSSDTLYTLQPNSFPGFAFSWLQLVSNRNLVPQLLAGNGDERGKGWTVGQKLVLALLKFLGPLLEQHTLQKATRHFYRGTLRFLVVLLHDFPEFLCENYMDLVQVIPHSCIQLRNLVLSAFPRVMHLPDPFTPDLCLDRLPEFKQDPVLVTSYMDVLSKELRAATDAFTSNPVDASSFYTTVLQHATYVDKAGEFRCRVDILGALVLYAGSKTASSTAPIEKMPAMQLYKHLLNILNAEGMLPRKFEVRRRIYFL